MKKIKFKVGDIVVIRKDSHMYEYTKDMVFKVERLMGGFYSEEMCYMLSCGDRLYPIRESNLVLLKDMIFDKLKKFLKKLS